MSHEISTIIDESGNEIIEAMYANRPAWHGLGTIFDAGGNQAPDSDEAMRLAHLDWRVDLEPIHLEDGSRIPDHFATVRQDTKTTLGIVGSRYAIQQNAESFRFLDSLLQDGIMRYESAMALRGGRSVVLLARMPSVDVIADGDSTLRYVLFSTSHDGTGAINALPTSVRVVCANTLRVALNQGRGVSIRHCGDLSEKLEDARRYLSQFDEAFTEFRDKARVLATRRYSGEQARDYIATLFPAPGKDASSRTKTNNERKVQAVRDAFRNERNNLASIRGSWWSLFNSVTETVDHGSRFKGSERQRAESRFFNSVEGKGAEFKAQAFELAVSMAV